jgi:hypothetical protein
MNWFKSKISELSFEDDQSTLNSINIIRKEFFKKALLSIIAILIVLGVYITYLIITYMPELVDQNVIISSIHRSFYSNLTIGWSLFSTTIFLLVYFLKLIYIKLTPSLISFVKNESKNIGFTFQRRANSGMLFLMLSSLSIAILIYMDFKVLSFETSPFGMIFRFMFLLYLILSLIVPVLWTIFDDKYVVKLKDNYFIVLNFQFKIKKPSESVSNLIGINLTSSRLSSKFDYCGKVVHSRISQLRWLPRKKGTKISPFLYFHEFSTPLNFQKQFLNIALALNEWQEFYQTRILCFNKRVNMSRIENRDAFLEYRKFFTY